MAKKEAKPHKCTIEAPRPCELATGVAFARDISEESGIPLTPKLQKVYETGSTSETQVRAALDEWKYSVPKDRRREADNLVSIVFPHAKGGR